MRVLHVPFTYFPSPCGGTEVYVAGLCRELRRLGMDSVVAAPGEKDEQYCWDDTTVSRFQAPQARTLTELHDEGDPVAAAGFERILEATKPDLVHFHAHTRAASLRCVQKCRERGLKVIYTYHTPTATCMSGTMMLNGKQPCDGEMRQRRCSACSLRTHGVPALLAETLSLVPGFASGAVAAAGLQGGMWTGLRTTDSIARYHRQCRAFLEATHHIIAVCDWVKAVLLRNEIPASKITLCRQGVGQAVELGEPLARAATAPLRVAYLGRLEPAKGVGVLIEALATQPGLGIKLDVYGITQGESSAAYTEGLQRWVKSDARIRLLPPVAASETVRVLRHYDLLAVPSLWQETGPLVVLEAFAAGIPVLGSKLGGIAELVQDGVNGWLAPAGDSNAWGVLLARLANNPERTRMPISQPSPRTMKTVAEEMRTLYQQVLSS